jgi:hypothetical protein
MMFMSRKRIDIFGMAMVTLPLVLLVTMTLMGCPKPPVKPVEPPKPVEVKAPEKIDFAWDSVRRAPRWRASSPIAWHKAGEMKEVLDAARKDNKPILAYISRYDSGLTGELESTIFKGDVFGNLIKDIFVVWEIDWWEDPALAQSILVGDSSPALVVLKVSPDAANNELRRVDVWKGKDLLSFPLHGQPATTVDVKITQKFASFAGAEWAKLKKPVMTGVEIDPVKYVKQNPVITGVTLRAGKGMKPEEMALAQFECLAHGADPKAYTQIVSTWKDDLVSMALSSVWMPDEAFAKGSGWTVDTARNLQAMTAGVAAGTGPTVDPTILSGAIKSMLVMQDGNAGGGFPAYFDIRNTYQDGPGYLTDQPALPPDIKAPFGNAIMGPRDIVWVNARMLAMWLKMNRWDASLSATCPPDKAVLVGFMPSGCSALITALITKAGDPGQMKFADKVYMLDALNEMYQYTADVQYLEKAGKIAATFPMETAKDWLDQTMFPLLPDLAMALHFYGWLDENESAKTSALYIVDNCLQYAGSFSEMDRNRMVNAYEVVHAPCIHTAVVGAITAPEVPNLLKISLSGWDPRRTGQVLDPTRDAKLIESKGYMPQEGVITFICIDDMCYPPARDVATVQKTFGEIVKDLATSDESGSNGE